MTLLYHHINDEFVNNITITAGSFRRQMDFLQTNGYRVISLDTALTSLQKRQPAPEKGVLLTFDDGYEDFYTVAFPILQEFGYPATVFPVIEAVGHWNEWNRRAPYIGYHLSWSQIEDLSRHGVTFGCHTLNHHALVRFGEQRQRHELEAAQAQLSQRIGRPVEALSYPYGAHNRLTRQIAAELFKVAFAVDDGQWDWQVDRYAIRRLKIGPATILPQLQLLLDSPASGPIVPNTGSTSEGIPDIKT